MATKFNSYNEAVAAAKAHNIALDGRGDGRGYDVSQTRACWDGGEYLPGYWTAYARHAGEGNVVRPI